MSIISPDELGQYLRQGAINEASAALAIRHAEGWLQTATGIEPWPPDPVPGDVWSWTLELAVIAYTNPQGISARTVGTDTTQWADKVARRAEILDVAARRYGRAGPVGSFDPPSTWPDPADSAFGWRCW